MKIYTACPSGDFSSMLMPVDLEEWESTSSRLNHEALSDCWIRQSFNFMESKYHEIGNVGFAITGALLMDSQIAEYFDSLGGGALELLPATAGGEDWYVLNCLNACDGLDRDKSIFNINLDEEITTIKRIYVQAASVLEFGVFCVSNSERGQVFFLESFVKKLPELAGGTFQCVGETI